MPSSTLECDLVESDLKCPVQNAISGGSHDPNRTFCIQIVHTGLIVVSTESEGLKNFSRTTLIFKISTPEHLNLDDSENR